MLANKDYAIPVTEEELVKLMGHTGVLIELDFGINYTNLVWKKDTPLPKSVELLAFYRGVNTENVNGDGI